MKRSRLASLLALLSLGLVAAPARAIVPGGPAANWVTDGEVDAIVTDGATAWIGGNFQHVGPYTGSTARFEGTTGELSAQPWPAVSGFVDAVAPDGNGGWYLGGRFSMIGGLPRTNLAHVLPDGTVDPAFAPTTNGRVRALQPRGDRVFIGGEFSQVNGVSRSLLAELDASGTLTAFAPQLAMNGSPVGAVGVFDFALGSSPFAPALYVVGEFDTVTGANGAFIRRRGASIALPSGNVTPWDPDANRPILGLAAYNPTGVLGNEVFFLAGRFTNLDADDAIQSRAGVAQVDGSQGLATSWLPAAATNGSDATDVAVRSNVVYVGGTIRVAPQESLPAAAFSATNAAQLSAWKPEIRGVRSIVAAGSRIYLGGVDAAGQSSVTGVDPTNASVQFAPVLGAGREQVSGLVRGTRAIGVSGNDVIVAGTFETVGGLARRNLAAVDVATGRPTAFRAPMNGLSADFAHVRALALTDDGLLWAGGDFVTEEPNARSKLAAFDRVSGELASFDRSPDGEVLALAAAGRDVFVGGAFNAIDGGVVRHRLAVVRHVPGERGAIPRIDPDLDGTVHALAVRGDTVFAGGEFSKVNQVEGPTVRNHLAALDRITGLARSWHPDVDGTVRTLVATDDAVYAGGDFATVGGGATSRARLAAFEPAGSGAALPWNPGADGRVRGLALHGSTMLIGGSFSRIGGGDHPRLAAVDASTGAADAFGLDVRSNEATGTVPASVGALAIGVGPRLLVGGTFVTASPQPLLANLATFSLPELPASGSGASTGAGAAGGGAATLRDTLAPELTALRLTRKRFRIGQGRTAPTGTAAAPRAKLAPKGTTLLLTLTEPAQVRIEILRSATGRRVGKACRPRTRANRTRKRCTLLVARGSFTRAAPAGASRAAWSGRIGTRPLPVGRYVVRATPTDAAGNAGTPRTTTLTVVRR